MFVIEANPRASRTVPFVSKATGVPLAKVAARVMVGATLTELRDRRAAASSGRRRPHRGEGGGAPVQPLPRRRHRARPRDALDRRGDGNRPHRSAWRSRRASPRPATACRARARCSSRSPTATRPPGWWPRAASPSSASRSWPPRVPPTARAGAASRRHGGRARWASRSASMPSSCLLGQGRPRGQHAAWPGSPRRRHPYPARPPPPGDPVRHHGRRRPRRLRRDAEESATSPRCGRSRSTTATASSGSTFEPRPPGGPVDLGVELGPVSLTNPIVAASGTFGHGAEVAALCDPRGLGAVTVKSVAAFPWSGNPPLRVTEAPGGGMLNSVGLPVPGSKRGSSTTCPRSKREARA